MNIESIMAANNVRLPFLSSRVPSGGHGRGDITGWARGTSSASRPEVLGVTRRFEPITDLAELRRSALRSAVPERAHDGSGICLPGEDFVRKVSPCDGDAIHAASCAVIAATGNTVVLHAAPPKAAPVELDEIEPSSLALWLASKRDVVIPRG